MPESPSIQGFIADAFKREARHLKKTLSHYEADLQPLIEQLQSGDLTGDRISGFADYVVYKIRIKNSNIRKGKSGGSSSDSSNSRCCHCNNECGASVEVYSSRVVAKRYPKLITTYSLPAVRLGE